MYGKAISTDLGYEIGIRFWDCNRLIFIEELHLWIEWVLCFEESCGSQELLTSNYTERLAMQQG